MRPRCILAVSSLLLPAAPGCSPEPSPPEPKPLVEYLSSTVTEGLGLPFSEAVRVGDLILLSGMVGNRPGSLELVPGGLEAETRQALENIRTILAAAGGSPTDIAKCTVMLDDIGRWSEFNEVYAEFFLGHRPARSAFGARGLALGAAVEIECVAVLGPVEARPGD